MPDRSAHDPSRRDAIRAIAAGSALAACAPMRALAEGHASTLPGLPREFRAAWVATVNNIDWPSAPGLPVRAQRDEIAMVIEAAARAGLNALILQVRPTADAFYQSHREPWSAFLTGRQGRAPVPSYDPLEVWIDEAHRAGLDLHAWVNPFRVRHPKSIGRDAPTHISNRRPDLVRTVGPYQWLDPGDPAARDEAMRVTDDLQTRYPIDGVHMDDYFYPYPQKDKPFPDERTYRDHKGAHGSGLNLPDWRRGNINAFIEQTARLVRARRPGAVFTVSPFGIWRPDNPPGVKGFDAYAGLYADSRRWLREGTVDALMPQLYWPIESSGQPFVPLLDWWTRQNTAGRHLWPGLYLTRILPTRAKEVSWAPDQIVRQIETVRTKRDATGFALFSMVGLTENRRGIADDLRALNAVPAFVPPSPWAGGRPPGAPTAALEGSTLRLALPRGGAPTRRFAVRCEASGSVRFLSAASHERRVALPAGARTVEVACVGSNGLTGPTVQAR